MMSDINEGVATKLLCSVVMLEQVVELLQLQSCLTKGRVV